MLKPTMCVCVFAFALCAIIRLYVCVYVCAFFFVCVYVFGSVSFIMFLCVGTLSV